MELRIFFLFDCGSDLSKDKCMSGGEGVTLGLILTETCVDVYYTEWIPHKVLLACFKW